MSVSYIVVDQPYCNLADAVEDIQDQLMDGEGRYMEDHWNRVDEVAPGPDPFLTPVPVSSMAEAAVATHLSSKWAGPSTRTAARQVRTAEKPARASVRARRGKKASNTARRLVPAKLDLFDAASAATSSAGPDVDVDMTEGNGDRTHDGGSPAAHAASIAVSAKRKASEALDDSNEPPTKPNSRRCVTEARTTPANKENCPPGLPFEIVHNIDWDNSPPTWDGEPLPRMPPLSIYKYLQDKCGWSNKDKVVCKINGCNQSVVGDAMPSHIQANGHFCIRKKCLYCGFDTRANNFSSRHRSRADCQKHLRRLAKASV